MAGNSIPTLYRLNTTAQILAPNDITDTRWQRLYPVYFDFVFVQCEEVETCLPSFNVSMYWDKEM